MRVLLWYWGRRGGGAHYTAGLAEALGRRPDVELTSHVSASMDGVERVVAASKRSIVMPMHSPGAVRGMVGPVGSVGAAAHRHADVVLHTMVNPLSPMAWPGLRLARRPLVTVVHDAMPHPGDEHRWMDRAVRFAVTRSDRMVAASDHVGAQLRGITRHPVDVVPLGPHLETPDLWDPDGDVVFFGRLRAYKGLDLLADAWERLGPLRSTGLRVVGESVGDPAVAATLARLRAAGARVEERWVPDDGLLDVMRGARLIVAPYHEATQSGVLTLAASARIPVLATDVGGLRDQLGDGGEVCAPTADAFLAGLERLIVGRDELSAIHGRLAARPPDREIWDAIAAEMVQVLERAVASTRSGFAAR